MKKTRESAYAKTLSQEESRASFFVILACVFTNFVDGFDVLAISFTSPFIASEWGPSPQVLGIMFGAGLAGIAIGSLFLSPFAERFGRRRLTLGCVTVIAASMGLCALAADIQQLIMLRFVTGLGVGGILSTLNTTVSESAPAGRRNVAISLFAAAYPLGSILGGWISIELVSVWGWRSVFLVGAFLSLCALLSLYRWLPDVPWRSSGDECDRPGFTSLFGTDPRRLVTLLSVSFFLQMFLVFFVLSWIPRLVEIMGFDAKTAIRTLMLVNIGSLAGGICYGPLADRFGWARTAPFFTVGSAGAVAFFAMAGNLGEVSVFRFAALAMGFSMGGSMTSLFAIAPQLLPAPLRVGGTGFAIGVGRMGGMVSPVIAGWALGAGLAPETLFLIAALLPLILTASVITLGRLGPAEQNVLDRAVGARASERC